MAGVSEMVVEAVTAYVAVADPDPLLAVTATGYDPASGVVPLIVPVLEERVRPDGRPVAVKESGACPVAGIVKRKGVPGTAA
jgi:hypothetical protein